MMDRPAQRNGSISSDSTAMDCENIRVYLRIRPFVEREDHSILDHASSRQVTPVVQIISDTKGGATVKAVSPRVAISQAVSGVDGEHFSFDAVGGSDVIQQDVFITAAKPITENCLLGYNGTIFAYGQTGSGKTFTMQGPANEDGSIDYERRGLIPRTFEHLFQRIREEERKSEGAVTYFCKCAYVEIYNECIYDLLVPDGPVCTLREDSKKGVFVEGCREEVISSPQDAFLIFEQGSRNRHVAETAMNRESSRSHCVFTIFIQSKKHDGQVLDIRESRFNLVDLAGSERQQISATAGIRLKEAGNINKSLLALSNVINALVDIANGKPRHVHYRDSRLTFLLRDSLGGNAKTLIIAAVSPSPLCYAETLSTLRFAQRAKQIKNKAIVNKDVQGNIFELQSEVRRLRGEVLLLKAGHGSTDLFDPLSVASFESGEHGDAYFMLQMALQRQSELILELAQRQQQQGTLEELLKKKDQQITSEKMVAKFRENTIKAQSLKLASTNPQSDLLDVFEAERAQYRAEIAELRKQVEHHPELVKVSYEAMQSRDKLKKIEDFAHNFAKYEETIAKHRRYEEALAERLLKVEHERESLKKRLDSTLQSSMEEVPLQEFSASCTLEKATDQPDHKLQRELEQMSMAKQDIESRYDDLVLEQEILRKELDDLKAFSEMREPHDVSIEFPAEADLEEEEGRRREEEEEEERVFGKRRRRGESRESLGDTVAELQQIQEALQCKIYDMEVENNALRGQIGQISVEAKHEAQVAFDLSQELLALKDKHQKEEKEVNTKVSRLECQVKGLTADVESISSKLALSEEAVRQLQETLRASDNKCRDAEKLLVAARTELIRQSSQINELEANLKALETALLTYNSLGDHGCGPSVGEITDRLVQDQRRISEKVALVQQFESSLSHALHENEDLLCQVKELQASADREKLAAAEQSISFLNQEIEGLQEELLKLRRENDKLIQHSNVKQKLQYHLQIKEENNHFREEIRQLREDLTRLGQRNIELEEALSTLGHSVTSHHYHHHHSERK